MFKKILKKLKKRSHAPKLRFKENEGISKTKYSEDDMNAMSSSQELFYKNLLRADQMTVADLKIPSIDIVAIDSTLDPDAVLKLVQEKPFQLYPVFHKNLDDVMGVVHIKAISAALLNKTYNVKDLISDVLFVSASMKILDLLVQMRTTGHMMAMVVDEYGGIDGLITAWDVISEIIGETDDEEDLLESPSMIRLQDGTYVADARLPLEDFEEQFGPILTEDEKDADFDTLGGLVIYLAGRVPDHKEIISHSKGIEFEVLEANPRRVLRLRIRRSVHS